MEISDYLRIIRRRIWIVVAIPVLAAVLVGVIVLNRPAEYSATATVAAPWLISEAPGGAYETANASRQFVADFIAAITLPPVVDAVAEATGASQGEIRENATATPIGESTLIQVRYITTEESEAAPAVRALALETLRFLFRPSAVAQESAIPSREDRGDGPLPTEQLELLLAQPETLSMSPTSVEPSGPELMRGLQIAVAGGLLLALLVVIVLELLPPDRLRRQAAPEPGHLSPKADEASAVEDKSVREDEAAASTTKRVEQKVGGTRGKRAPRADEGGEGGRKVGGRQRKGRRPDGQEGAADGTAGPVLDAEAHKADRAGHEQKQQRPDKSTARGPENIQ